MGGRSSSTSEQKTQQVDRRIGASDAGQVAAEGSTISNTTRIAIESVDPAIAQAALGQAFGFGKAAIASSERTTSEALDFGGDAVGQALELTERALSGSQTAFQSGLEEQRDLVETVVARGSEDLQGLKQLLTTTAIVAVGAFALIGFGRR